MITRIAAPVAAAFLLATPVSAQQAETAPPVIPAPAPEASQTEAETPPVQITPATKSGCAGSRNVTS